MARTILGLALGLLAVLLGITVQHALFTPPPLLVAPSVTDARVAEIGLGRQVIVYRAPGSAFAWRRTVADRLMREGWVDLSAGVPSAAGRSYVRTTPYPFSYVLEQIDLFGEANEARIVRRWRLVIVTWRFEGQREEWLVSRLKPATHHAAQAWTRRIRPASPQSPDRQSPRRRSY